jgi:RNA-directed DNA polymerase
VAEGAGLVGDQRQKIQLELALTVRGHSEARRPIVQGTEAPAAKRGTDSPAGTERLMEEVCERANLKHALRRVQRNGGSPGIDGMTVDEAKQMFSQFIGLVTP